LFRVLKPGGKLIAVFPARYDARFWYERLLPWERWLRPRKPVSAGYFWTGRELRTLFSGFGEIRIRKSHLRRSDLPHLWRWMMLPGVERLLGRFLSLRTFKPLSTALTQRQAA
jgi:SAM-dependent methyltransferase